MNFLKTLHSKTYLKEFDDNSELSEESIKELQKLIRSGAEKTGQWSNALELVHKAYSSASIERPNPEIKGAWKQYETLITYSVNQLSKFHGQNGTWRMTSESFEEKSLFEVGYKTNTDTELHIVEAKSMKQIVEFFEGPEKTYKLKEIVLSDSSLFEVWEYGIIKTNINIEIRKTK